MPLGQAALHSGARDERDPHHEVTSAAALAQRRADVIATAQPHSRGSVLWEIRVRLETHECVVRRSMLPPMATRIIASVCHGPKCTGSIRQPPPERTR